MNEQKSTWFLFCLISGHLFFNCSNFKFRKLNLISISPDGLGNQEACKLVLIL